MVRLIERGYTRKVCVLTVETLVLPNLLKSLAGRIDAIALSDRDVESVVGRIDAVELFDTDVELVVRHEVLLKT